MVACEYTLGSEKDICAQSQPFILFSSHLSTVTTIQTSTVTTIHSILITFSSFPTPVGHCFICTVSYINNETITITLRKGIVMEKLEFVIDSCDRCD